MTNEKAIQFLDNIKLKYEETGKTISKDGFYAKLMGYHVEALNKAIKALETIPKYKDAYNKGWDDGAKATNIDCGVVWEDRIDAIKDDIQSIFYPFKDGTGIVQEVLSIIDKHCGGDKE